MDADGNLVAAPDEEEEQAEEQDEIATWGQSMPPCWAHVSFVVLPKGTFSLDQCMSARVQTISCAFLPRGRKLKALPLK